MKIVHSSKLRFFMSFILFIAFVGLNNMDAQRKKKE